jgi:hypothetical protein
MIVDVAQNIPKPTEKPVQGETYSLFGESSSSRMYYEKIRRLADSYLLQMELPELIHSLQRVSGRRRYLKNLWQKDDDAHVSKILRSLINSFSIYTKRTNDHLQNISAFKLWDRRLSTTEEQYLLFMLEIESINRLNRESFKNSERRLAFLLHCLHDLERKCMATPDGIDYVCKGCSKNC